MLKNVPHYSHCLSGECTFHLTDTRFITKHVVDEDINPARAEQGDADSYITKHEAGDGVGQQVSTEPLFFLLSEIFRYCVQVSGSLMNPHSIFPPSLSEGVCEN